MCVRRVKPRQEFAKFHLSSTPHPLVHSHRNKQRPAHNLSQLRPSMLRLLILLLAIASVPSFSFLASRAPLHHLSTLPIAPHSTPLNALLSPDSNTDINVGPGTTENGVINHIVEERRAFELQVNRSQSPSLVSHPLSSPPRPAPVPKPPPPSPKPSPPSTLLTPSPRPAPFPKPPARLDYRHPER